MLSMRTGTARFGELSVGFGMSLYDQVPRTIAFCAPVQLCEGDLVAALWLATSNLADAAELADMCRVRELVTGAIVNVGLEEVNNARHEVADVVPGTDAHAWVLACEAAVHAAFAPALTDSAALAGVA